MASTARSPAGKVKVPRAGRRTVSGAVRRRVPALVLAVLAASAAAPGAAALHEQGPDQEDEYLFSKAYPSLAGEQRHLDFFPVGWVEDDQRILCYVRAVVPGVTGTWSATVYDDLDVPRLHESGTWVEAGPLVESVHVPVDTTVTDPVFGAWAIQVRATGFAPETHVWIEWVGSVDECGHPPT